MITPGSERVNFRIEECQVTYTCKTEIMLSSIVLIINQ